MHINPESSAFAAVGWYADHPERFVEGLAGIIGQHLAAYGHPQKIIAEHARLTLKGFRDALMEHSNSKKTTRAAGWVLGTILSGALPAGSADTPTTADGSQESYLRQFGVQLRDGHPKAAWELIGGITCIEGLDPERQQTVTAIGEAMISEYQQVKPVTRRS